MSSRLCIAAGLAGLLSGCGFGFISDEELADRLDVDNDGWPRRVDCDDNDPSVTVRFWFVDADQDGYGNPDEEQVVSCDWRPGLAEQADDCDDRRPLAYPGAPETCNRMDDDCDGRADDSVVELPTFYKDKDGDSFGDEDESVDTCFQPDGWVSNALDCDDNDPDVNGGIPFYEDADGDSWGDSTSVTVDCDAPDGKVPRGGDCDDSDPEVNPGAMEVCDELDIDEDCDGWSDDDDPSVDLGGGVNTWADSDGDGLGDPTRPELRCEPDPAAGWVDNSLDCDDSDPFILDEECPYLTVSAGSTASCAVRGDHRLVCWGQASIARNRPSGVYTDVAVGGSHACGLALDGTLDCWGDIGSSTFKSTSRLTEVDIDGAYTCASTEHDDLQCWGNGLEYRIGSADHSFTGFAVGFSHTCFLMDDEEADCLGMCDAGECHVPPGPLTDLGAGREFSCALSALGQAGCWGNFDGTVPNVDFVELVAYGRTACGSDAAQHLTCWSADADTDGDNRVLNPPPSTSMSSWDVGLEHGCGIRAEDGSLVCWGENTYGQAAPPVF